MARQSQKNNPTITESWLHAIITTVINAHPAHCIFIKNTAQLIVSQFDFNQTWHYERLLDELELIIQAHELYCPHESINRLPNT